MDSSLKAQASSLFNARSVTLRGGRVATLRPLEVQDGPKLGDFYESVPREDLRFYNPHPLTREHACQNAAHAASPTEAVLVGVLADGSISGYAWFRWREGAGASTFGICIGRAMQGSGLGRALMTRLLEIARVVGPPVMQLTVQKANARAVALYQKMGFQIVREQMLKARPDFGFEAEPEYFMERRVR